MYAIVIKIDGKNPLTGRFQYRVKSCDSIAVDTENLIAHVNGVNLFAITKNKPQKVGTIINPRKALFGDKK